MPPPLTEGELAALATPVKRAQTQGWIGRGEIPALCASALRFAEVLAVPPPAAVDLGSGGGIPGLVLALHWPTSRWLLTDRDPKRCAHLRLAIQELDLGSRVRLLQGDALAGSMSENEAGQYDLVVARSFGPPAVTVESGVGFLARGSQFVISDPPDLDDEVIATRWPAAELGRLGLERSSYDRNGAALCVLTRRNGVTTPPRLDTDVRADPLF